MNRIIIEDIPKELKEDLLILAELVYEVSKKYGDIYLTATKCKNAKFSWATVQFKDGEKYYDVDYSPQKKLLVSND